MDDQFTLDSYISTNKKSDKSDKTQKGRQNRNRDDNNQRRGNNQRGNNRFRGRGGNNDRARNQNRNRRNNQRDSNNWNDSKFDRRQRKGSFNNKEEEERTTGKYVIIENLHYSVTEEELQEHVSKYGEVIQCKIFWDDNGRSKEKAIIQFENEEDAKEAIEDLEGSTIEDQTLTAHYASNDDVGYVKKTKKIQKQSKAFNRRR